MTTQNIKRQYAKPLSNEQNDFRVPPQDSEAEQAVLGAMVQSEQAVITADKMVKENDFYRNAHRVIFRAMLSLHSKSEPIDMITLTTELRRMKLYEDTGGVSALTTLLERVPTAANVEYYCKIVAEKSMQRYIIRECQEGIARAYDDGEESGRIAEDLITKLALAENFVETLSPVEMAMKVYEAATNETNELFIPTGWKSFDEKLGGIRRGVLTVITGEKETGKSTGVQNVCVNVSKIKIPKKQGEKGEPQNKYKVAYVYIDGIPEDFPKRTICMMNNWSLKRWESTDPTILDFTEKSRASEKYRQLNIRVGGRRQFGNQWKSIKLWMIREWKREKIDFFVVDGGERIHTRLGYNENKYDAQEMVVDELEQLAYNLNVGLWVIVGQGKKQKHKYAVVDEDEVGTQAWARCASLRLLVSRHKESENDERYKDMAVMKITKNRNSGGKGTFMFKGTEDTYKWTEVGAE